jgi:hypothetical protein
MEQQRFASLTGRARELLPADEFDPEPYPASEHARSSRRSAFVQVPAKKLPLARIADALDYKSHKSVVR